MNSESSDRAASMETSPFFDRCIRPAELPRVLAEYGGPLFAFLLVWSLTTATEISAGTLGDRLTVNGVLAGASQHQNADGGSGDVNERRGAGPFQLELGLAAHRSGELFAKFGFAAGNGLNENTCFALSAWAADHEADVVHINGRSRNHLLTAWYRHTFEFDERRVLGITVGIIDATDYVDQNTYANDEYTQFMNEALVNGPNSFAPSYDYGGSIELAMEPVALTVVVMEVGENDDGNEFLYGGVQIGYRVDSRIGVGNYRLILQGTDRSFLDVTGRALESRGIVLLSFDQQLGRELGAWTRVGWQSDRAAVNYKDLYSAGIDISGSVWGRASDNIGAGYAYLVGGNVDLAATDVAEVYLRVGLNETFQVTGDIQYMRDESKENPGHRGFIVGLRLTALF